MARWNWLTDRPIKEKEKPRSVKRKKRVPAAKDQTSGKLEDSISFLNAIERAGKPVEKVGNVNRKAQVVLDNGMSFVVTH